MPTDAIPGLSFCILSALVLSMTKLIGDHKYSVYLKNTADRMQINTIIVKEDKQICDNYDISALNSAHRDTICTNALHTGYWLTQLL